MFAHIRETTDAFVRHFGAVTDTYIRILLTRGVGGLTYSLDACPRPTLVIIVKPFPAPAGTHLHKGHPRVAGLDSAQSPERSTRRSSRTTSSTTRSRCRKPCVTARDEALMLNQSGHIVECSQSNFFMVTGGGQDRSAGRRAAAGHYARVCHRTRARAGHPRGPGRLHARGRPRRPADEAFITGTTREVTPVVRQRGRGGKNICSGRGERVSMRQTMARTCWRAPTGSGNAACSRE